MDRFDGNDCGLPFGVEEQERPTILCESRTWPEWLGEKEGNHQLTNWEYKRIWRLSVVRGLHAACVVHGRLKRGGQKLRWSSLGDGESQEVSSSRSSSKKLIEMCREAFSLWAWCGMLQRTGLAVAEIVYPRLHDNPVCRWNRQRAPRNGIQPSTVCLMYNELV